VSLQDEARARHALHVNHQTHRPLSDGYELLSLVGEEAFARLFGVTRDKMLRANGDGGVDFEITAYGRQWPVDVKTARKPFNLLVEEGKCKPKTIYVLAKYDDDLETAYILGWEWGARLLRTTPKAFGHGVLNHYIPLAQLRPICELLVRHFRETGEVSV